MRLSSTHIRNGILYVVNEIGVDNTGASTPSTTITRNGARFYMIDIAAKPPTVINQGTIFKASPTNDTNQISYITPSIMSNASTPSGASQVIVSATTSGTNQHLNATYTPIISGNIGSTVTFALSNSAYFPTEDWEFDPNPRWGDHTRISIDPTDNRTFWPAGLWCSDTNIWATQIAQVALP